MNILVQDKTIDTILPTPGLETPHVIRTVAVLKLAGSRVMVCHTFAVWNFEFCSRGKEKGKKENTERACKTEVGEF